jgi:hypothetical protein
MKDNPKTGVKHKMQKSFKFQIEEDKVFEAYITHWQELETQDRVQPRQELEVQDYTVSECHKAAEEGDHNLRHGAKAKSGQADSRK